MTKQPNGYLSEPASGTGPAVLVLHAWWGLNQTIREICDRLAAAGYIAFAPDIYHGKLADSIESVEVLGRELDNHVEQAKAEIAAAIAFLKVRTQLHVEGIAVVGFSLGAYYALSLSASQPNDIHSVVVFYGTGVSDLSHSRSAYLGHFAESDPFEPQSNVDFLADVIRRAGCTAEFHTYAATGHWFFEADRRDAYNFAASDLAWQRTLEFLERRFAT